MTAPAPWLSHYDADVRTTLEPYPRRTLVDAIAEFARTQPDRPAMLFKGACVTYGELERLSDACRRGLRRARHHARRSRRAAPPQLPAVLYRAVRRLEARRHRRAAEPDLHRARARRAAARPRHRDGRDADAVLPADQDRAAAHQCQARDRDQHQGIFSAGAARAVHAAPRKARRRSDHAEGRRSRLRPSAAGEPRPAPAAGDGRPERIGRSS